MVASVASSASVEVLCVLPVIHRQNWLKKKQYQVTGFSWYWFWDQSDPPAHTHTLTHPHTHTPSERHTLTHTHWHTERNRERYLFKIACGSVLNQHILLFDSWSDVGDVHFGSGTSITWKWVGGGGGGRRYSIQVDDESFSTKVADKGVRWRRLI